MASDWAARRVEDSFQAASAILETGVGLPGLIEAVRAKAFETGPGVQPVALQIADMLFEASVRGKHRVAVASLMLDRLEGKPPQPVDFNNLTVLNGRNLDAILNAVGRPGARRLPRERKSVLWSLRMPRVLNPGLQLRRCSPHPFLRCCPMKNENQRFQSNRKQVLPLASPP